MEDLERHGSTELEVTREENDSHAPFADAAKVLVFSEPQTLRGRGDGLADALNRFIKRPIDSFQQLDAPPKLIAVSGRPLRAQFFRGRIPARELAFSPVLNSTQDRIVVN